MWVIWSLLAAASAAIVVTLSKAGIKNVDPSLGFAVQAVLIFAVSWTVVWWQGNFGELARIERQAWIYLVVAGVVTCLSSLFLFRALKTGQAGRVGSLDRVSLVFAIILAVVFLKERITWQIVAGAALMTAGAVVIAISRE